MKKILYSAIDTGGREAKGYVNAMSESHAFSKLEQNGFSNIVIHESPTHSIDRSDLDYAGENEQARMAALDIEARKSMPSTLKLMSIAARENIWIIVVGGAALAYGIYSSSPLIAVIGAIVAAAPSAFCAYISVAMRDYNKVLASFTDGDWDSFLTRSKALRKKTKLKDLKFDLDIRTAYVLARTKDLDTGLAYLREHADEPDTFDDGVYDSRLAEVHTAGHDYETSLKLSQNAYFEDPTSTTFAIDLANREARYGSKDRARKILASVDLQGLNPPAIAYLNWTHGVIHRDSTPDEAITYLSTALNLFEELSDIPLIKGAQAGCAIDLALALHQDGNVEHAKSLYESAWPLIKHHSDRPIAEAVAARFET